MEKSLKYADRLIVTSWHRWLVAVLALAIATGFNFAIQPEVEGRVPFLPFFPALALVGLVAGLGPGVGMLLASVCLVGIFWVQPLGVVWPIAKSSDAVAMVLYVLIGTVVLACAAGARSLLRMTRRAREAYVLALQAGKMAAWHLDVQTDVLTFTEGANEVLGTSMLPKRMHDGWPMVNAADRAIAQVEMEHAIQSGQGFKVLTRIGESDPVHWVETHGRVTRAKRGNVQINAVMVDVTERQQALLDSQAAAQRLHEEAKRKDMFIATLAHELRNPMAPIRYAVAMLGDDVSPAVRQRAKDIIGRQASHMARLIDTSWI